jgi:hypothetical protein
MFSSTVRVAREKEILLSQHHTYLSLLSQQQKVLYNQKKPKEKGTPSQKTRKAKKSTYNYRDFQRGAVGSKLHLFAMIHNPNTTELAAIASRLIEILYSFCDFYKEAKRKDIAQTIVHEMIVQKIKRFEDLAIKDTELDKIYYKMLQGTSSSYPPLTEYCHLGKKTEPPIRFRFASTPVMQAALGQALAQTVFDLEKESGENNSRKKVLTKSAFEQIVKNDSLTALFTFENSKKGLPQSCKRGKIRVSRGLQEE